jgi:serine/threonine protein kinase
VVAAVRLIHTNPGNPERVGRYELVAEIASGGMATVYLARLVGMGGFRRLVALKRLHPHLARETEFVQMFLDEARLAAMIHDQNVVPLLEVGESEGAYFLVMEYVEGDTLAQLLAQANADGIPIGTGVAVRILLDVLAGLHAAHELRDEQGELTGLVHRDVSPQNVLVGVEGISRITDFGVARAATRLATSTRVGQLKGKIAYMAPEQASGEEGIDRRADIFAAGIVLWEVLTGRRLFKAENEAATLWRVVSEPIAPPSRYLFELDPRLSAVCMKALERDPARRYQSCAEFGDALERAASDSHCLGTTREVAQTVGQILGSRLVIKRDRIRMWFQENAEATSSTGCEVPCVVDEAIPVVDGSNPGSVSEQTISEGGENRDVGETWPDETSSSAFRRFRGRWWWAALAMGIVCIVFFFWLGQGQKSRVIDRHQIPAVPSADLVGRMTGSGLGGFPSSVESLGASDTRGLGLSGVQSVPSAGSDHSVESTENTSPTSRVHGRNPAGNIGTGQRSSGGKSRSRGRNTDIPNPYR